MVELGGVPLTAVLCYCAGLVHPVCRSACALSSHLAPLAPIRLLPRHAGRMTGWEGGCHLGGGFTAAATALPQAHVFVLLTPVPWLLQWLLPQ
jgi:hypothetical protein